jgi:16S rRNA (cytosine967-C5)-methyltransferase
MSETARKIAWSVLERVERDRSFADLALHGALRDSQLERRDRAFATELVYGTLRMRGRLDAALGQVLDRPLRKLEPPLRQLMRLGAYQLLCLPGARAAAAVDECVKLAKQGELARASGLVNAVLRSLSRRLEAGELRFPSLADDPQAHLTHWLSLPDWLAQRWLAELGVEAAAALAETCLGAPPRTVRVAAQADRIALARELGGQPTRFAPRGITGFERDPVREPAFEQGLISVQDEASQLVPLLLGAAPGDVVVDCCAAPGAKTAQLAELVGPRGEVIALELHQSRLNLIYRSLERAGLRNVRVLQRDVRQGFDLQGAMQYSHILVDAPCTGLGTLRRNPDARWRLSPADVERSAQTQRAILSSVARYARSGGVVVYSVCTCTPEETSEVIRHFLAEHPEFRVDDPRKLLPASAEELVDAGLALRTWPHLHGCDGFYAVRLVKA